MRVQNRKQHFKSIGQAWRFKGKGNKLRSAAGAAQAAGRDGTGRDVQAALSRANTSSAALHPQLLLPLTPSTAQVPCVGEKGEKRGMKRRKNKEAYLPEF